MSNILIIKHGSLGDIVFALEPILAIQNKFDDSVIDLVTEEKIPKLLLLSLDLVPIRFAGLIPEIEFIKFRRHFLSEASKSCLSNITS